MVSLSDAMDWLRSDELTKEEKLSIIYSNEIKLDEIEAYEFSRMVMTFAAVGVLIGILKGFKK